jgi:hypothetical protein
MGILDFNYDDVERPTPIPEGDYLFRCTEVDDTGTSKKTGRGFTKISLVVVDEGEAMGKKASYFMSHPMLDDKDTEYDDGTTKFGLMHRMMADTFRAFGIELKKGQKFDTSKLIGQETVGTIKHEINEESGDIFYSIDSIRAA